MKFATIGHLIDENTIKHIPKAWIHENIIISPEMNVDGTKGHILILKTTSKQMMNMPKNEIRQRLLDVAVFAQNELGVDVIQLGALTTSVTSGGNWLVDQNEYNGFVTHGDSYTAAVTCQAVEKVLNLLFKRESLDLVLAVVGAYGIIGEAVSKILMPKFKHSILIGPREKKLNELEAKLEGSFETTMGLKTKGADIIVTATSHPTALLYSEYLKENAIAVDVSQPPNLSLDVCKKRPDVCRIDGGYVDFPTEFQIPGLPNGKLLTCIAEVIMQAQEKDHNDHVGSIEFKHLQKTEEWAKKYGYVLKELTNFGKKIKM